jgi:acyl-CoA thioesterase
VSDAVAADLAVDTAVKRVEVAPGWYTADLPPSWNFRSPSGGVLMTVALRAMRAELADPTLRPVSANTLFCSPVPEGPMEIRVEVLRRGKSAAQVRAALSSTRLPGPGLEVSATFARDREGVEMVDAEFPPVPPPEHASEETDVARSAGRKFPPFFHHLDTRIAFGSRWWVPGWTAGPARFGRWFRYRVPQRDGGLTLDPLAIPPIADTMPAALAMGLGPDKPFYAPSLDLTIHFIEDPPPDDEWLLVWSHARRAHAGRCTVDSEIWTASRHLVAYATQVMWLMPREPR